MSKMIIPSFIIFDNDKNETVKDSLIVNYIPE